MIEQYEMKISIVEYNKLKAQLAKANERVKELELVIISITHADETGYVDDVGFVEGWSDVCDEAKALLNKFAAEKKVEGAYAVISLLDETKDSKAILMANKYVREQLRKEQS